MDARTEEGGMEGDVDAGEGDGGRCACKGDGEGKVVGGADEGGDCGG